MRLCEVRTNKHHSDVSHVNLRRANRTELNRRLNFEEKTTESDLQKFVHPAGLTPGGAMLPLPAQAAIPAPDAAGASGGSSSKSARGPVKDTIVKNPPTAEGRWYSSANHFLVKLWCYCQPAMQNTSCNVI